MRALEGGIADAFRRLEDAGQEARFFLRDDDTDVVETTLTTLLDICRDQQTAINLAVIPGKLTDDCAAFVRERLAADPELVEVHQHGWVHVNHELQGRK